MTNLRQKYVKEVVPALREKFGYKNIMAVPKIEKAIVNIGLSRALKDPKLLERIQNDIAVVTGQKPAVRKAKKSISGFKVRQGMDVGMLVTLRGKRMYDFLEKLVNIALPRTRDFRGIEEKKVDSFGNLNLGIKEQNVFPEIEFESTKDLFSFQITVTTTAKEHEKGVALFKLMGFPIKQ